MRLLQYVVLACLIAGVVKLLGLSAYTGSILVFAAINILLCLGFYVIFGLTGILSLAHAAFMAIGAYTSGILSATYGWPIVASVCAGTLAAALAGALLGLPTLRLRSHYLVLVTIAFSEVLRQMLVNLERWTGGVTGLSVPMPSPVSWLGVTVDPSDRTVYLLICLLSIAVMVFALTRLRQSRVGHSFEAVRDDELAASVIGIDLTYTKILAFVISAALAGYGGALSAHFVGFISPDYFTFDVTVLVLAMVVIGGKRSIVGVMTGALLLTFLPEALRDLQDWYPTFYGVLLLVTLWVAPNGIAGRVGSLSFLRKRREPGTFAKPAGAMRP
ncbi:MAG: branched-chain amino acid ABC transporter permease [Rhizobiaceae bacterium]